MKAGRTPNDQDTVVHAGKIECRDNLKRLMQKTIFPKIRNSEKSKISKFQKIRTFENPDGAGLITGYGPKKTENYRCAIFQGLFSGIYPHQEPPVRTDHFHRNAVPAVKFTPYSIKCGQSHSPMPSRRLFITMTPFFNVSEHFRHLHRIQTAKAYSILIRIDSISLRRCG